MNDKDWKEYRLLAVANEHPEVSTADVVDLLDERDELRATLRDCVDTLELAIIALGEDRPSNFMDEWKRLLAHAHKVLKKRLTS